jgi:hypothetical protein
MTLPNHLNRMIQSMLRDQSSSAHLRRLTTAIASFVSRGVLLLVNIVARGSASYVNRNTMRLPVRFPSRHV